MADPNAEKYQDQLMTASNQALIQRAVKGSVFYPITMGMLLLATDWYSTHTPIGVAIFLVCLATASFRFGYLKYLLKHPETWTAKRPRGLSAALLGPTLAYGIFAATTLALFGVATTTSVLTILVVLGFAAGGTSSLAMSRKFHLVFLLTMLLPISIAAFATGTGEGFTIGSLFLLNLVFLRKEGAAANNAFVGLFEKSFALHEAFNELAANQAKLVEVNESMKLVLDNIEQGLCVVDSSGIIESHTSKAFDGWFGAATPGVRLVDHMGDVAFAEWFDLSVEMLSEGFLPADVVIDQLPTAMLRDDRHLSFAYRPIQRGGDTEGLLVVISDITERIARQEAEREQRELVHLFQLLARDPDGFREFRTSASVLVRQITDLDLPRTEQVRALHTLKGNAAVMGVASIATLCHQLEDELTQTEEVLEPDQVKRLVDAWQETEARMSTILGDREEVIELTESEHEELLEMIEAGVPHRMLAAVAKDWRLESVPRRFERMAGQATRTARNLDKDIDIQLDVPPLRLDPEQWRDFWLACIHLMRNSVDHGIEDRDTRLATNKPPAGKLYLSARREGDEVVVNVRDDGKGIDWSTVAAKADAMGLPSDTDEALCDALFSDGLSTRDEVTDMSGRGVGLSAVAQETSRMGGTIAVKSEVGIGTEFTIRVPYRKSDSAAA